MNAMHRLVNATSGGALLLAGTTAPNVINHDQQRRGGVRQPVRVQRPLRGADDFYKPKDDIEPDPVRGLAMRRTQLHPRRHELRVAARQPALARLSPRRAVHDRQPVLFLDRPARERPLLEGARAHLRGDPDLHQGQGLHDQLARTAAGPTPWQDGKGTEVRRLDYEPVGIVTAAPGGARWYHQHFSVSKEPFRLTAWFGPHNPGRDPGPPGQPHVDYTAMDLTEGGTSIPYWMEDPFVRAGIRGHARARGRAEPDGPRLVREAGGFSQIRSSPSRPRPPGDPVRKREASPELGDPGRVPVHEPLEELRVPSLPTLPSPSMRFSVKWT